MFGMVRFSLSIVVATLANSLAQAELLISEFMAQNVSGLKDHHGEYSDWIEIHNPGPETRDLEGYSLTDSSRALGKWKFPRASVEAGGYLLVFASGRDEQLFRVNLRGRGIRFPLHRAQELHTNFKLDADGEYLALVKPDGKTVCHAYAPKYPSQRRDVSYGIIGNGGEISRHSRTGRLLEPTPGKANAPKLLGFVHPVQFSQEAGFFEKPFALHLKSATPGAEIRYTLTGGEPSPTTGEIYSQPLSISATTIMRAVALKEGYKPALAGTRTFLFLDDVLQQSPNGEPPPGWPGHPVNGQHLDYGMDPRIVGEEHTIEEVKEALRALPALSLVLPLESLFGRQTGIYVNARRRGREWEREASLELLNTDGSRGFQVNGGLRVRGGFSRQGSNPKHGFRMLFRKQYVEAKLRYSIFGEEGAAQFDKMDFRSSMNYSWALRGGKGNTLLRDVFSRDTQRDMGQPYTRSRFYHLYLNGHYWGVYMTQERAEADFGATYLGGEKEDYDTIKTHGEVVSGTGEARGRLYRAAMRGFEEDADYFRVQGLNVDGSRNTDYERLVDVDNVIDYMLITFYSGDKDGPGGSYGQGNNYFSIYNRENPDGFKYFEHDSEHSLGLGAEDMTGSYMGGVLDRRRGQIEERQSNVHWLHSRLAVNPHYIKRFTERTEMHLFGEGALTPEACLDRLEAREKTIDKAIIAHSARWGDAHSSPPKTREHWVAAVGTIKSFISTRNDTLLRQLHARGWYTGLLAPSFNRPGGLLSQTFKLHVLTGEGEIFITTDGSDPRGKDGQPSATAFQARIPTVKRTALLPAPVRARVLVPTDGHLGLRWTHPQFDDRHWIEGPTGVGYESNSGYEELIGIDLEEQMHNRTTTAYIRTRFQLKDPATYTFDELALQMRYDDGFIAYLNGRQIAAANAPANPNWRSLARTDHADQEAVDFVAFPLDGASGLLRRGENLLAIHGLDGESSSDFIITPKIEGVHYIGADPIPLDKGETTVRARSRRGGRWSPMAVERFRVH